ncbi:hypothetical protein BRADI_1g72853v3 [Brachypodium distachyon]|uniref:Uncharacterized protein n=1 Tax=Brachypodium distachyon TaxID=15368 RepID=A0A2K2DUU2_BRADI|nr:hypothetical protein BRADI_1g72853v3 [Brachypodium distachyon]
MPRKRGVPNRKVGIPYPSTNSSEQPTYLFPSRRPPLQLASFRRPEQSRRRQDQLLRSGRWGRRRGRSLEVGWPCSPLSGGRRRQAVVWDRLAWDCRRRRLLMRLAWALDREREIAEKSEKTLSAAVVPSILAKLEHHQSHRLQLKSHQQDNAKKKKFSNDQS